jgi:CHAT domain-containing protein
MLPHAKRPPAAVIWIACCGLAVVLLWWWISNSRTDAAGLAYAKWRPFELRVPGAPHGPWVRQREQSRRHNDPDWLESTAILARARKQGTAASEPVIAAYADLWSADAQPAIDRLRREIALEGPSGERLAALGAAYFLRGEQAQNLLDYVRAAEQFQHVLELTPERNADAFFNLALCAERLGLHHTARDLWVHASSLDRNGSGWHTEAKEHLERVERKIQFAARNAEAGDANVDLNIELLYPLAIPSMLARSSVSELDRLRTLAEQAGSTHSDFWLLDAMPHAGSDYDKLAAAIRHNRGGDYRQAEQQARAAQQAMLARNDAAGAARAALEVLYALQRTAQTRECKAFAENVRKTTPLQRYPWIDVHVRVFDAGCRYFASQFEEGRPALQAAIDTARERHYPMLADRAQQFLAAWYFRRGDLAMPAKLTAQGLDQYWSLGGPPDYGQNHASMVSALTGALGLFRAQTLAIRERIAFCKLMENPLAEAVAWSALGSAKLQVEDGNGAGTAFRKARQLLAQRPADPQTGIFRAAAVIGVARAGMKAGDWTGALRSLEKLGEEAAHVTNGATLASYLEARAAAELGAGQNARAEITEWARVLLAERGPGSATIRDRLLWSRTSAAGYAAMVRSLYLKGDDRGSLAVWQQFLNPAQPAAEQRQAPAPPTLRELLSLAAETRATPAVRYPATRFISFATYPDGVLIWAVDGDRVRAVWRPVIRQHLVRLIERLRATCADPSEPAGTLQAAGAELYSILLAPVEEHVHRSSKIVLQLEGFLRELPFQALRMQNGQYLGIEKAIEVIGPSSPSPEQRRQTGSVQSLRAVVVGTPAISPEFAADFPPLPDASEEAREVAGRFANAKVLTGAAATIDAVADALQSAEVFHYAGHAMGTPDGAALILAPSKQSPSGFWRGGGLEAGQMHRCRLAVFSACETAKAEEQFASDPLNLVGSFLSAGVAQVVASRWRVDSKTSASLMSQFYEKLSRGLPVAEALQAAMVGVQRERGKEHPYYWAPFTVYGRSNEETR